MEAVFIMIAVAIVVVVVAVYLTVTKGYKAINNDAVEPEQASQDE